MSKLVLVKDEPVSLTRKPIELNLPEYGIYIGESRHERGFEMDPMRNDYTKVYYILEGAADCITQDKTIKLSPENLLVIPTGMEHYLKDNENSPLSLYILAIEHDSLDNLDTFQKQIKLLDELGTKHFQPLMQHDYAAYEIPRNIRKILYEQRVKTPGYIPVIQATMLSMIVAINRIFMNIPVMQQFEDDKPTVARIRQVANYIRSNFYEPISVEHMARMACLSVRQFTNQFKAVHGVTFMQYLHYHRVSFAQKLLAETDQDISAICFESGFNDLAHFYRIFKRLSGCSPRKYRLNAHKEALKNAQPENEKA
ncbi:MAG: helix-turn-helix transcriptional regulator [Deferribacteres bacterium]|nr:helix-turn-helix domain-containing protein [candidate division KSB1 bacterium]MCB9510536.1 helix-turn-helix transcriptional regulator [Deferribacteres bacterium]